MSFKLTGSLAETECAKFYIMPQWKLAPQIFAFLKLLSNVDNFNKKTFRKTFL